ncbi:hypothetical protein H257_07543 [Aphanomyces astaci]|uniref:Reverse transcriptase domain-containing protein n=1 Tax=Aphanomyces astaci TaxID=112090 RepID=W4GI31_APHAT|nr:hypothetical protein H257_07543 [Aphanomyces astaci]ETV78689.1 hypothetical protein H257_07543 [Aphanomyces astaci]|eukprot:XP_009831408.1 hypothetical protein H257_07543 [Aphanomyces astaci]
MRVVWLACICLHNMIIEDNNTTEHLLTASEWNNDLVRRRSQQPLSIDEVTRKQERRFHCISINETLSCAKLNDQLNLGIDKTTIARYLLSAKKFEFIKMNKAPKLTEEHMKNRVKWAMKMVELGISKWGAVVFSDENKWSLDGPNGLKSYWHCVGLNVKTVFSHQNGDGSIMEWGGIWADGTTELAFLEGPQTLCMPGSKTRKPQLTATKDIAKLFDYPDLPDKLRQDLCVLTRHQRVVINTLRAQIPEAKNSDARNAIQEITNWKKSCEPSLNPTVPKLRQPACIPRSKTLKSQLAATKNIGQLFDCPDLPVKLRQDLRVLTRHQRVVINKLRAQIPEAKKSDAHLLIHRNDQTEELIEGVLDRKIQVYHKARKIKAEATWYQERLSRGDSPSTLIELEEELQAEFEPDDLQNRLRDQLYELKQAHCASLTEYVAKFRRICTQVCHRISDCRSPPRSNQGRSQAQPQRNNISRHANRPQRPQRNTPSRQHNAQLTEVHSDTEDSDDDVEEVILGNNMDLAQQDSGEEESLNISTTQQASKVPARENKLMIVHGALDSPSVRILIDSLGASKLLCRPGLAKTVIRSKEVRAEGFDGHCSGTKKVKEGFDVILGKPCFFRCNPVIDWRTHQIRNINSSEVEPARIEGWMIKVTTKTEPPQKLHPLVARVVDEFRDVFPDKLPNTLPPPRGIEFDLTMKPDVRPQHRPPVRLSKVGSLDTFGDDLLKKGWIELSNSDWVSNIFGVPSDDDTPTRWVLDYRHVNSQSIVPKVPLPNIEDVFDRIHGCRVFTKIDLASGYHQMLVMSSARKYTTFRTHRDVYEWVVTPMGMAGMPGIWSRLMRRLFDKFDFVVVYTDDICVFSRTIEEHADHLRSICTVFRTEKLYARPSKCSFGVDSVNVLGHTISKDGLHVDQYYRKFIPDFAEQNGVLVPQRLTVNHSEQVFFSTIEMDTKTKELL